MAPTLSKPVVVSLGVALGVCLKEKRKPKKKWSKRWLVDRKKYAGANLLMELEKTNHVISRITCVWTANCSKIYCV